MRLAPITLFFGLALTGLPACQDASPAVVLAGTNDCRTGAERACAARSTTQPDRDGAYDRLVEQDVRSILTGMRSVQ